MREGEILGRLPVGDVQRLDAMHCTRLTSDAAVQVQSVVR